MTDMSVLEELARGEFVGEANGWRILMKMGQQSYMNDIAGRVDINDEQYRLLKVLISDMKKKIEEDNPDHNDAEKFEKSFLKNLDKSKIDRNAIKVHITNVNDTMPILRVLTKYGFKIDGKNQKFDTDQEVKNYFNDFSKDRAMTCQVQINRKYIGKKPIGKKEITIIIDSFKKKDNKIRQ